MDLIGTYNYFNNNVIINKATHVSAPAKISECLTLDEFIILLLDADELKSNQNVYCYDIQGSLKWIIPALIHENYYTSIYVRRDLYFYAYNQNGVEVKLDYRNGEILGSELSR